MGFTGQNKNEAAQVAPGAGTSHKARLRRKKRELAEEAEKMVADYDSKSNRGRVNEQSHQRRSDYMRTIAGETDHYFDWLRCRMYPNDTTKARIPDATTTHETSLNAFRTAGTFTASDAGTLRVVVAPFLASAVAIAAPSGTGVATDWGDPTASALYRNDPILLDYAAVVPWIRCCGYDVNIHFNGNLTSTQGQFVIADAPPQTVTTFSDIMALPGARYGAISEIFQRGDFHWYGEFESVDAGYFASDVSGISTVAPWNHLAFHRTIEAGCVSASGTYNVPHIVIGFSGLIPSGTEIALEVNYVFEGIPKSKIVPRAFSPSTTEGMVMGGLASHPVVKQANTGSQKHHRESVAGDLMSSFWTDSKKVGKWVVDHWGDISDVGADVLKVSGMAAGLLPMLL